MDFIKQVIGREPVPAGGSAAAYSLCLAIGLIYKVILFEVKRGHEEPAFGKNLLTVKKELDRLLHHAQRLVEEDSETCREFADSRRNKQTDQLTRRFQKVIDASMRVLEQAGAAFGRIEQIRPIVPERMSTHLRVAGELIMGAVNGTVHVAWDNFKRIRNEAKRENYPCRLNELYEDYRSRYQRIGSLLNTSLPSTHEKGCKSGS